MLVSRHVLITTILAILLYPFFGVSVIFLYLFGVFIDVDHYLHYIYEKKDISLIRAYKYHMDALKRRIRKNRTFHVFHTIETFIVLLILALVLRNNIAYMICLGWILHAFLDLFHMHLNKVDKARYVSVIEYFYREFKQK